MEPSATPTLFSRIIAGEIPGDIIYRDDRCIAFRDIAPAAPVHVLVVPIEPIPSLADVSVEHEALLGHLLVIAAQIAHTEGIAVSGYRVIINTGTDGGQTVAHLHLHILGGHTLGALVADANVHPTN